MAFRDELGDRMKGNYENRSKTALLRRTPVIIRIDGKAFHTFTKKFQRPYDKLLHTAMNETLQYLCKNIQGCKFGYTQSDEITLVLTDYDTLTTDAWFGYEVQKMCSIAASMTTMIFNKVFDRLVAEYCAKIPYDNEECLSKEEYEQYKVYSAAAARGALFDARVFNIPENEIVNCFIWRQQDATRNAVQMLGQTYFSHNELQDKSSNDIQDMLFTIKGINFNDMPVAFKRGICCYKKEVPCAERLVGYKTEWILDENCPIFTQDRNYIEQHLSINKVD